MQTTHGCRQSQYLRSKSRPHYKGAWGEGSGMVTIDGQPVLCTHILSQDSGIILLCSPLLNFIFFEKNLH